MEVSTLIIAGVFLLVLLLFELPRKALGSVLLSVAPLLWSAIKAVSHTVIEAHACVLSNLRPREVVLMMKESKPTSASNHDG